MEHYKCQICGYIYNPEEGDPSGNVQPGTEFEDVHDEWVCPLCAAGKSEFERVDF